MCKSLTPEMHHARPPPSTRNCLLEPVRTSLQAVLPVQVLCQTGTDDSAFSCIPGTPHPYMLY